MQKYLKWSLTILIPLLILVALLTIKSTTLAEQVSARYPNEIEKMEVSFYVPYKSPSFVVNINLKVIFREFWMC